MINIVRFYHMELAYNLSFAKGIPLEVCKRFYTLVSSYTVNKNLALSFVIRSIYLHNQLLR